MKKHLILALFLGASACSLFAQVTDTTVCDVLKNPKSFDGKIVRIKGTVAVSFDQFVIHNDDCGKDSNGIWLAYPQGTKAKSGPAAMIEMLPAHNFSGTVDTTARAAVTLDKNTKDFKQFDNLLSQQHSKTGVLCLGCFQNQVNATITGRLDSVASISFKRDSSGKITSMGGFGNMNAYFARLVIQSVSDVSAKPSDYSKADKLVDADSKGMDTPEQAQPAALGGLQGLQKLYAGMKGKPMADQLQKAVEAYPKGTDQNGVTIVFGPTSEVPAGPVAASAQTSPDGLLFVCTFNKDKVREEVLQPALVHMGQHISDIRSPAPGNEEAPVMIPENNAWVVSVETGMYLGSKFVTLPGGYLMWSSKWPQAEQVNNMTAALQSFLNTEEMLTK